MKAQHTPTPWIVLPPYTDRHVYPIGRARDNSESFNIFAEFNSMGGTPEECRANADFAVRACNAHEDLLEACKLALPLLEKLSETARSIDGIVASRLNLEADSETVQAAIEKAS